MGVLDKTKTNKVIMTLTEKCTLTDPNFLFVFYSQQSEREHYFHWTSEVTSEEVKERYDYFIVTPSDLTTIPEGTYNYKVYEQEDNVNEVIASTTGLIEQGIIRIVGSESDITNYSGADTEVKNYNG